MKKEREKKITKRNVKKLFHALVVGFAVVAFWRGIWGLLDIYLFPDNHGLSYGVSLILGIMILILTKNAIKQLLE